MKPELIAIAITLLINALLIAYNGINAARAFDTMKAVKGNNRLRRVTYSEKELAKLDYSNYRVMFSIAITSTIGFILSTGGTFYLLIKLTGNV